MDMLALHLAETEVVPVFPRADGRAVGPAAGDDVQRSARKEMVFGAARVYTVAVSGQNGNPGLELYQPVMR